MAGDWGVVALQGKETSQWVFQAHPRGPAGSISDHEVQLPPAFAPPTMKYTHECLNVIREMV